MTRERAFRAATGAWAVVAASFAAAAGYGLATTGELGPTALPSLGLAVAAVALAAVSWNEGRPTGRSGTR